MGIRRKHIRTLVENLLAKHDIKRAPVQVDRIATALGIKITLDEVDDNLSGFLLRDKRDGRNVIGANKAHPKNRQRFTVAHELGHFLLHEGELVHLDEEMGSFTVDFRDAVSSKGEDVNEKEANYFAAELLMPEKFLRQDLRGKRLDLFDDGEELQQLARKYKVSTQALTFRLTNLNYIKA
jgi:Zn-dependent peptidase ImmA (M78 family)